MAKGKNLGDYVEKWHVKKADWQGEHELEVLGVSNVDGITTTSHVKSDDLSGYLVIEPNTFAYNPYRINVGSVGLTPNNVFGVVSPAYIVFKVREGKLIPELLLEFLKSFDGLQQINKYARGTVRKALRFDDLCKIEVNFPDYNEQKNIFEKKLIFEKKSDELETEIQTQKQLLSQLKQSILQEAIQGKLTVEWRKQNPDVEPANELLKRIKAEKTQLIKDKKIRKEKPLPPITEDEIPFELPEGWVWCRFGDIVSITSGDGLTSKQMIPGEIPVFGGNGINGYHNAFNTNEETVTIGRVGAYCGAVHLTPKFAWITDNCFRVYHDQSSINRDYLIWHLRYMNLGTASYDGSQPVISGRRVYPLLTFLPPFEEQKAIVEKVKTLMQKCQALEQEIKSSEANALMLMQAVLKEAFESKKEELC